MATSSGHPCPLRRLCWVSWGQGGSGKRWVGGGCWQVLEGGGLCIPVWQAQGSTKPPGRGLLVIQGDRTPRTGTQALPEAQVSPIQTSKLQRPQTCKTQRCPRGHWMGRSGQCWKGWCACCIKPRSYIWMLRAMCGHWRPCWPEVHVPLPYLCRTAGLTGGLRVPSLQGETPPSPEFCLMITGKFLKLLL